MKHERIAVDADVLIYLLENVEPRASLSTAVIDAVDDGGIRGSISTVAQVEVLVGPARSADPATFERTAEQLRDLPLDRTHLTAAIAEDAAWIRGRDGLGLADAIHVASARAAGATAFVTNNRRISARPELEIYYLDDLDLVEPTV
jgi:predicted nucleic acid-binding protein